MMPGPSGPVYRRRSVMRCSGAGWRLLVIQETKQTAGRYHKFFRFFGEGGFRLLLEDTIAAIATPARNGAPSGWCGSPAGERRRLRARYCISNGSAAAPARAGGTARRGRGTGGRNRSHVFRGPALLHGRRPGGNLLPRSAGGAALLPRQGGAGGSATGRTGRIHDARFSEREDRPAPRRGGPGSDRGDHALPGAGGGPADAGRGFKAGSAFQIAAYRSDCVDGGRNRFRRRRRQRSARRRRIRDASNRFSRAWKGWPGASYTAASFIPDSRSRLWGRRMPGKAACSTGCSNRSAPS